MTVSSSEILNAATLSNAAYKNSDRLLTELASSGWTVLGSDPVPLGPFAGDELPKPASAPLLPTWDTYFGEGIGDSNFLFDNLNAQGFAARRGNTLAIVFRGTDTIIDKLDWLDFQNHYAKFGVFIDSVDLYLQENPDISTVYVTGHSLGAAMVHAYMASHPDAAGRHYTGVTFASPGADAAWVDPNAARTTNFHNAEDVIDFAAYHTGIYQLEADTMAAAVAGLFGLASGSPLVAELTFIFLESQKAQNRDP
ncbi:MAG: hypothetical protein QOF70_6297, partial [Acetobacteraceae bacterium]|nr:hypothetical protein [Acetobacteraceae bacterium]